MLKLFFDWVVNRLLYFAVNFTVSANFLLNNIFFVLFWGFFSKENYHRIS